MHESFVSLVDWLRPAPVAETPPPVPLPESRMAEPDERSDDVDEAIRAARRFRAALADALDCRLDDLLERIASDVLGRELALAPADIRGIVTRVLEAEALHPVVRVRVHPLDLRALAQSPWDTRGDETLRPGDAMIDVASGSINLTMGTRLARVLGA